MQKVSRKDSSEVRIESSDEHEVESNDGNEEGVEILDCIEVES
jgi:hypothetical protein